MPEIRDWDTDLSILPVVSKGCPVKKLPRKAKSSREMPPAFAYNPKDVFSIKELLMQASTALRMEMPERGLGHLCHPLLQHLWHTCTAFPQGVGIPRAQSWLSISIFQSLLFFLFSSLCIHRPK